MNYRRLPLGPLIVLIALVPGPSLTANMAAPLQPGDALGEPDPALASMAVERERLEIDLRPLASEPEVEGEDPEGFGRALVSAYYLVRNDGPARRLTLEFVAAAADTAQWSVWVDGREITSTFRESPTLPPLFATPRSTPGIDGRAIAYEAHTTGLIRFEALLDSGRHAIRVEYVARATRHVVDHPLVHWQLAYILAPARRWSSFGHVAVSVIVPPRWQAVTEPSLVRRGNVLRGSFEGIPADAIAITARARYDWWFPLAFWGPPLLALAVGGLGAFRAGRSYGRRLARFDRSAPWAIPASFGAGFVLMVAIPAAGMLGAYFEESLVGSGQQPWGYGYIGLQLFLAIVAFATGFGLAQMGAVAALRRSRRRYDARWTDAYASGDAPAPDVTHQNGSAREPHR